MNKKRRTFEQRIFLPILIFFALQTIIVAVVAYFSMWWIALLFGIGFSLLLTIFLKKHVNHILSFSLKRITSGDPTEFKARDEDINSNEEIAMVYSHFSEVISNFNMLQMDIGAMADDHLKSIHSTAIDESKYKGATLELVRRVNAMGSIIKDNKT